MDNGLKERTADKKEKNKCQNIGRNAVGARRLWSFSLTLRKIEVSSRLIFIK